MTLLISQICSQSDITFYNLLLYYQSAAHAGLLGNQHYMTFDHRFYEFAGDCNYVMARDFIDGSFAAVVNYERVNGRVTKKSITVQSGEHKVEIFSDGRVIMDDARTELPVSTDTTEIMRDGNIITVENRNGVEVRCDLTHNHCTVSVSGWYFGKTAGLLGTYNNEPSDDLLTSDRRRVDNVGEFAASWSTSSSCRPVNSAVDVVNEVSPDTRRYEICARYFKRDTSPYRRCFHMVDPEPFMRMCLNDMPVNENRMESEGDTCDVGSFYAHECSLHEVPIKLPNTCGEYDIKTMLVLS